MTGLEDRLAPPPQFRDASGALHELVRSKLGSDDFGPDDYLEGLEMVLLSMDYDPRFNDYGRRAAWVECYNGLFGRAHAYKSMRENPGFDSEPIRRPLIITGIPRTGTTALHKLLAVDPQFQGLQGWLIAAPQPRPARETWADNPLFQNTVERLAARHASRPGSRAAHDMAADEVDECIGVMRQGFRSILYCSGWSAASYDLWLQTQSERPCYEHLYRVLQLIGCREREKTWLLKNPSHICHMDLLFETFPDARVVQTHRDPGKAIPSISALMIKSHSLFEEGRLDMRTRLMGVREVEKWAKGIRDAEPIRQARRDQILDVVHDDFHDRPMETVERIYAFAGLELTPQTRVAMKARIEAAPERQHGVHSYDVSDFGFTEEQIRRRFGDYVERFDLVRKKPKTSGGAP